MKIKQLIEPESIFEFHITKDEAGMRIDKYMAQQFPLYSRTFFSRLIADGHIRLNNTANTKASMIVHDGDRVTIKFPPKRPIPVIALQEKSPPVEIISEHPHFFILYKPAGLLVHSPSMRSNAPTLVDWLMVHFDALKDVGYIDRPGIVHRLDKDTSGILIVPRTNYAHTIFSDLFRERTIDKKYYAIVKGHPDKSGIIDLSIGRCPITKTRMTTKRHPHSPKMRTAITQYRVLEYFDDAALVEVMPITGRTHQIRVHFAAIGHPLIGDQLYNKKSKLMSRQALHAYSIGFQFEGKPYSFSHEPPEDFKKLVTHLRANATSSN